MVGGGMRRTLATLVLLLLSFVSLRVARAQSRTSFFIEQLRSNDDYRVRTQAALALGASGEDIAVQPLCGALRDSNVSVKVAAAAALGKLAKPSGLGCLQAASRTESAPSVRAQIQKSISALEAGSGGSGGTPSVGGAKFYVAIQVTNKTTRSGADIDSIVRGAMQARLLSRAGYAVAPKSETPAQGGQIVKGKGLKGFFLLATVEAPAYSGGSLTQVVRVSMFTYPEKSLQGEFTPKFTQSDTPKGDVQSENTLLKMCAETAIDNFQKVTAAM
jgi:hypothetical protein